uniref:Uncharacterized protein n=1 Tax=Nelumbo nucifera TaxID=4432 RepID=A0A822XUX7_NELNU|nr:TPA_asm: hypothetical protein HUJ06_024199 [Nelumbo nucifera]
MKTLEVIYRWRSLELSFCSPKDLLCVGKKVKNSKASLDEKLLRRSSID